MPNIYTHAMLTLTEPPHTVVRNKETFASPFVRYDLDAGDEEEEEQSLEKRTKSHFSLSGAKRVNTDDTVTAANTGQQVCR